jgi:hypothetical protein
MKSQLLALALGILSLQFLTTTLPVRATTDLPAGKYGCLTFLGGLTPMYGVGAFGSFVLDGNGKYTNSAFNTSGTYQSDGSTVRFLGGKFDGYSAKIKRSANSVTLKFEVGYARGASSGVNRSQSCTTSIK